MAKSEPKPSRPHIPGYGIPESDEGLLPWSHIQQRMQSAVNYWISTTGSSGQPHATPVWGVWIEDKLYFDGSPKTRRGRDLADNPKIAVHLEDGMQAVILEGQAHELIHSQLELRVRLAAAYTAKYTEKGYSPTPEIWEKGGLYVFKPEVVFAWTQFPKDTTRWIFEF